MKHKAKLSRRAFIARTAVLGCSAAASPLITPITFAAAPWDARLVVIILRGGMDGLDVVQPHGDPSFAGHRPGLGHGGGAHDLDGFFALNAGLSDLMPLWRSQELAFVHAVSTPYRDKRSHFDGQDLLEAGTGGKSGAGSSPDGWLNRMLADVPGVDARTAFAVGREDMIILNGDAPVSSWSPDARLDLSARGQALLEFIYHDDPIFRGAAADAMDMAQLMDMGLIDGDEDTMGTMSAAMQDNLMNARKAGRAESLARFAGERLNEDTRVASFSIGGWDTHRTQGRGLKKALGELSAAISTLKDTLGPNWQKTTVMAMTEFGRTVRENGAGGTDHGTGGAMVLAGGAVRGGRVYGDWPGLRDRDLYDHRDLMPTGDVRAYAAWAMRGMFGLQNAALEARIFPGLDMGGDPRILA